MATKRPLTTRKSPKTLRFRSAHYLVDWLNSETSLDERGHQERIGRIIEKLNALRPPQKRFRKARGESRGKVGIPQGAKYETFPGGSAFDIVFPAGIAEKWFFELRQLNESISDCFARPHFQFPVGDGWTLYWKADSAFGKHLDMVLSNAGAIAHVRRCTNCKRWFFADRLNQTSCSKRCRNEKYAESPQGKARTRKRMREYMAARRHASLPRLVLVPKKRG